jgi:hypothetical protein
MSGRQRLVFLVTVFLLSTGVLLVADWYRIHKRPFRLAAPVTAPGELSAAELEALARFGRQVVANHSELWDAGAVEACAPHLFGVGYGSHWLCAPSPAQLESCFYINYGIERDWSLDTSLSRLGCRGLGASASSASAACASSSSSSP